MSELEEKYAQLKKEALELAEYYSKGKWMYESYGTTQYMKADEFIEKWGK